jgi:hypothetical protein
MHKKSKFVIDESISKQDGSREHNNTDSMHVAEIILAFSRKFIDVTEVYDRKINQTFWLILLYYYPVTWKRICLSHR